MSLFHRNKDHSSFMEQKTEEATVNVAATFAEEIIGNKPLPRAITITGLPPQVPIETLTKRVSAMAIERLANFSPTSEIANSARIVSMPIENGATFIMEPRDQI
jgi:hypothetical protein